MSYRLNDYVPDPSWKRFGPDEYVNDESDDGRYVECPSCNERIWVDAYGRTEEGKLPLCPGSQCQICKPCHDHYQRQTGCEEEFD